MRSSVLFCLVLVMGSASLHAQVEVTTWHNDIARTGQNTSETTLTHGLVGNINTFGRLCSATVDGQVYAQPLVVHVTIGGVQHTAVFVVTNNDTVYAFDGVHYTPGQPCLQLASRHLPQSGASSYGAGILGTPVMDTATKTLYLVANVQVSSTSAHYVYALDITSSTLANKVSPVEISGGAFISANALQRAGLLGLSGSGGGAFTTIYVAFARTGSSAANHRGWVFSYRAPDLAPLSFYCVTCGASPANGGGIWQGGAGLASGTDSSGRTYLFIATGDGNFDLNTGGKNAGDSFLKMDTDLSVVDYFTPSDQACRICLQQGAERDVDFGAGGVTLIPDGLLSNYPFLAVVADKGGSIWVIDRNNPGKYHGSSTGQCPNVVCTGPDANVETLKASTHEFHNSPAYWNGSLYYAASGDKWKLYPLANSHCSAGSPPLCSSQVSTAPGFAYGATPSVSSNGSADGIVWAIESTGKSVSTAPGVLYAFAAGTLTELYNSSRCQVGGVYQDQPGAGTRFSVPTIANGRVYIGTMGGSTGSQGGFHMYGPLTRTCGGTR
jgi:hypothetical protein